MEFVLGSSKKGGSVQLFAIDFGLAQYVPQDFVPTDLLMSRPPMEIAGLDTDIYIPQDSPTTKEFKKAALSAATKISTSLALKQAFLEM